MKDKRYKKVHTLEDQLYNVGLVLLIVTTIAVVILKLTLPSGFQLRKCLVIQITGYYCPGCGATRAFIKLLEGDIIGSFIYHPVVLYVAVVFGTFMISHTIEKIVRYYKNRSKNVYDKQCFIRGMKFRPLYLYLVLVILIFNMIVKNILIYMGIWSV